MPPARACSGSDGVAVPAPAVPPLQRLTVASAARRSLSSLLEELS